MIRISPMQRITTAFLLTALVSTGVFAQNLLLSCSVKAKFDAAPIESATITVKVENLKNHLYIDIDGPEDYQGGFVSQSSDTSVSKSESENLSDKNNFILHVKSTMKTSGNSHDTTVRINRATGMFYLLQYSTIKGQTFSKDISGECKKISSANKF